MPLADGLSDLLDSHGRALHALLLRITLDRDAAADLFQKLFARLGRSAGFRAADDRVAFAHRVAINLGRDWRRRRRRTPRAGPLPLEVAAPSPGPEPPDPEELARVLDALAGLKDRAAEAICLRYLQQMTYEEVGRVLGRSAHQARALCHAGIVRLRRMLSQECTERRVNRVTRQTR